MSRVVRSSFVVLFMVHAISSWANAQSSTRAIEVPTVIPNAQPQYGVQPYQTQAPVQGSTTRSPMAGQVIEQVPFTNQGPVIQSQPMGVQQGQMIQGQMIQQGGAVQGMGVMQGQPMQAPARVTFDQKLWNYLLRAKYKNWAPVPGKSDAAYEGESPHGAYLKMYLNRRAAGNADTLPNGSIVVKENFGKDKELAAITVMYKTRGYNPKAGDWYWVKYNTDGTVATKSTPKGAMRMAGRVGGCIDCHGDAGGGDFAFFND